MNYWLARFINSYPTMFGYREEQLVRKIQQLKREQTS